MKRPPLEEVLQKAVRDQGFFRELLKDPVAAAANAGISLSGAEKRRLTKAVTAKKASADVDIVGLVRRLHKTRTDKGLISSIWPEGKWR